MEDRKRILSLPLTKIDSHHVPQSPLVTSQETGVLKPILIDKQLSEPNSPTSKTTTRDGKQHQKPRQIHRGYSDLGTRVKKRVTLRLSYFHLFLFSPLYFFSFLFLYNKILFSSIIYDYIFYSQLDYSNSFVFILVNFSRYYKINFTTKQFFKEIFL